MRQQLDELEALLQRMLAVPVDKLDSQKPDTAQHAGQEDSPVSYTAPEEPETQPATKIDFQALKQQLAAETQSASQELASASPPLQSESPEMRGPNDESSLIARQVDDGKGQSVARAHEERIADRNEESWVPLSSTWQPSSLTWKPLAQSWQQSSAAAAPVEASSPPVPTREAIPAWRHIPAVPSEPSDPPAMTSQVVAETMPAPAPNLFPDEPRDVWDKLLHRFNQGFDYCLRPLGPAGVALRTPTGRLVLAILGVGCLVAAAVVVFVDWIGWTS